MTMRLQERVKRGGYILFVLGMVSLSFQIVPRRAFAIDTDTQKVFGTIEIRIRQIFDRPRNALYRSMNRVKIQTKEKTISRELLFKSGDPYNPFLVSESERVLRDLKYLRDARVVPYDHGQTVDIVVEVQDTWTVLPQLSYSSGDGRNRRSVGILEGNLLGRGDRTEVLYEDDSGANTIKAAYDSRRLFGSKYEGQFLLENGNEGEQYFYKVGDPFRSLPQKTAWSHSILLGDTIERLYAAADERFVYRKQAERIGGSYAFSIGNPSEDVKRFQIGFSYLSERFYAASASDFADINVDPVTLRPEGGELAPDRKFVGPTAGYQYIQQDFIRRSYIDRFSRIEDFNLGERFGATAQLAPRALGSSDNILLLGTNFGEGYRLQGQSFSRWEFSANTRILSKGFENSILSLEGQYFYPLGMLEWRDLSLGNHTIAIRSMLDYADKLDLDKEFRAGGDNIIRGYDAFTFTGDKRFALNIEDRIHLAENIYDVVSLGMAFFADVGGATNEPLGDLFANDIYADVGIGLRFAFPKSTGERVARLDLSIPLRDGPDGSNSLQVRLIFGGGQLYGSQLGSERNASQRVGVDLGF